MAEVVWFICLMLVGGGARECVQAWLKYFKASDRVAIAVGVLVHIGVTWFILRRI